MPEPRCSTLVLCLLFGILNTGTFPIAYAQSIITPATSLVVQGNPWGITFHEIVAPGFALERVELLPGSMWQVTARMSSLQTEAYTGGGYTPVLFISPESVAIPLERSLVRPFMLSGDTWLTIPATPPRVQVATTWPGTTTRDTLDMVIGEFDYAMLPGIDSLSLENNASLVNTPRVYTSISVHPTIADVHELQIHIPHIVFTALHDTVDQNASTRALKVGVAYLHSEDHNYDHLHSGIVRVDEMQVGVPDNFPGFTRSFTAITSQRYSFIKQPTVQLFETVNNNKWIYIGVVTFALEDGVTMPQFERNESVFGITPSITASDETTWLTLDCPNATDTPTGCASDLADKDMPFCSVQPIWQDPTNKTVIIAYRIKLQISKNGKQPTANDNLFLRLLVQAEETGSIQPETTHSFVNIQLPFLASSIRCGGVVVQEQSRTSSSEDNVQIALYSGMTLVPMQQTGNNAPLLPEATFSPRVASTASNLRARSIIDTLVTTSLIGDDASFALPFLRSVSFVDILTVHVRDPDLYETLLKLVNGGAAYSVNNPEKRISIAAAFSTACAALPTHCAIRELMRAGTVLLPSYVHVANSIEDDVTWVNKLVRDEATSPKIAQTFVENVYQVMKLNDRYRRVAWVATQYEWTSTDQTGIQDHTLIFASFATE
jgi:hypothetical protein